MVQDFSHILELLDQFETLCDVETASKSRQKEICEMSRFVHVMSMITIEKDDRHWDEDTVSRLGDILHRAIKKCKGSPFEANVATRAKSLCELKQLLAERKARILASQTMGG